MPEYIYRCPVHEQITRDFPMGAAPPTVLCGICKRECERVYQVVPVQYHGSGFTRSLGDRPDERLKGEIEHSMDVDPVTGESWEAQDRRLERKKAHFGESMKKTFGLPKAKGA